MKKGFIFLLFFLFNASLPVFPADKSESKVIFMVGKVTVNKKNVKNGQVLKQGDMIETGKNSKVHIRIGEKSIIALASEAKLIYNLAGENQELLLENGSFGAVLNKGLEKKSFVIRTPALTAGVRGTSFFVEVVNQSKSYFCVCNGVIRLAPENEVNNAEDVKAAHHAARYFTREEDGKIIVQPGGLLHHDDKTLESLAKVIDVKIDWKVPAE